MTISTIAAEARARSRSPVDVRFRAMSSLAWAGATGLDQLFRLQRRFPVLDERAKQRHRRDSPENDRPDHPAVPRVELRAQDRDPDPENDRAEETEDDRDRSDHRHPVETERLGGGVNRAHRDDDDPGHDKSANERCREQQVKGEDPVLKAHLKTAYGRLCADASRVRCRCSERLLTPRSEVSEPPWRHEAWSGMTPRDEVGASMAASGGSLLTGAVVGFCPEPPLGYRVQVSLAHESSVPVCQDEDCGS